MESTRTHIFYTIDRINGNERQKEQERKWANDENIHHKSSFFFFGSFLLKHFCACDKRTSWNYIFRHTHTHNCSDHPLWKNFTSIFFHSYYIESKWWSHGQCAGIVLMLIWYTVYTYSFETFNWNKFCAQRYPLTAGAHINRNDEMAYTWHRHSYTVIHLHYNMCWPLMGIDTKYYGCEMLKNHNTSRCNLY